MIRKIVLDKNVPDLRESFSRQFCLLISALFLLGACAETQLIVHTAKRLSTKREKSEPIYKVGNPYKIQGIWYYPRVNYNYSRTGIASWYGPGFHGKKTANGEIYDQNALTAAHQTLPMPSLVQVTNLENGRSLRVKINDRGPFAHGRIIDLSRRGSQLLGFYRKGTARVRVEILEPESRLIAQQAMGTQLASIESPIRSDTKMPKDQVARDVLLPPEGAKVSLSRNASGSRNQNNRRPAIRERIREIVVEPSGKVTRVPIKKNNMYVQVGAFTQYSNAFKVAVRLGDLKNIRITSKIVEGREFFRVRAGPLKSLKNADTLLESILRAGFTAARLVVD